MDVLNPVRFNYKKDYIDPLYVPYLRKMEPVQSTAKLANIGGSGENDPTPSPLCTSCQAEKMGCGASGRGRDKAAGKYWPPHQQQKVIEGNVYMASVNPWEQANVLPSPALVNPALVRKGWGKSFQRKHSYFPCPNGWTPGADGWCVENEPEEIPLFYTDKAFIEKNQYWSGYTAPNNRTQQYFGPSETKYRGGPLMESDKSCIERIGCGPGNNFGSAPPNTGSTQRFDKRGSYFPKGPFYGNVGAKDSYLA
jgi:hypothetical protein